MCLPCLYISPIVSFGRPAGRSPRPVRHPRNKENYSTTNLPYKSTMHDHLWFQKKLKNLTSFRTADFFFMYRVPWHWYVSMHCPFCVYMLALRVLLSTLPKSSGKHRAGPACHVREAPRSWKPSYCIPRPLLFLHENKDVLEPPPIKFCCRRHSEI
jgi:hypothetical protein